MSLGIDVIPFKTCSYDCLYCEVGRTTHRTVSRRDYAPLKEILEELEAYFREPAILPDYITIGGSGEPTLHAHLGSIITGIRSITPIPVAVLTNSSLIAQDEVKSALLQADVILPSLDAVSFSVFQALNRPHPSVKVESIIQGLIDFRHDFVGAIWLEILFCQGINDQTEEIGRLKAAIERIAPDQVHLNTVDRPPAEENIFPVSSLWLEKIKTCLGDRAEVITAVDTAAAYGPSGDERTRVLELLRRRPCTLAGLARALGIRGQSLAKIIEDLKREGRVHSRTHNDQVYYLTR